jgi:hypothetical protein
MKLRKVRKLRIVCDQWSEEAPENMNPVARRIMKDPDMGWCHSIFKGPCSKIRAIHWPEQMSPEQECCQHPNQMIGVFSPPIKVERIT